MSSITSENKITVVGVISLFVILFYALGNFDDGMLHISLRLFATLSALLIFFKRGLFRVNIYLKLLAALFLWSGLTALYANNTEVASNSLTRMIGVFAFSYVIAYLSRSKVTSYLLCLIYIVFFINCLVYAHTHILSVISTINVGFRLSDEKLNANIFGYFLFIITFIIYHLGIISKNMRVKLFWNILFLILIPLTFYIAILTASRQILILQIPYFAILLYYRYWKQSSIFIKMFSVLFLIFAVIYTSSDIATIYNESNLATRSKVSVYDDPRMTLAESAFKIGLDNPIVGVGPDNFKIESGSNNFSHNSYLELFANSGLIAAVIFITMILHFIILCYKRWKMNKSSANFSLLFFGIFYAIDNIFYVFYLNCWLMGIFVFVASSLLYRNKFIED